MRILAAGTTKRSTGPLACVTLPKQPSCKGQDTQRLSADKHPMMPNPSSSELWQYSGSLLHLGTPTWGQWQQPPRLEPSPLSKAAGAALIASTVPCLPLDWSRTTLHRRAASAGTWEAHSRGYHEEWEMAPRERVAETDEIKGHPQTTLKEGWVGYQQWSFLILLSCTEVKSQCCWAAYETWNEWGESQEKWKTVTWCKRLKWESKKQ